VSVLHDVMLGWIRRVARSRHRERIVLRGSLLMATWGSSRPAADVDHLVVGSFDLAMARAMVDELLANDDDGITFDRTTTTHDPIWAETPFPGLRTKVLGRAASGSEALLQIDLGYGDPLAVPPVPCSLGVLGVRPETMLAWKIHGLFEFGHGSWRAKDLYDLWLLDQRVQLADDATIASLRLAFESRTTPLSVADRFLFTEAWGASRGSRRRWESFGRRSGLELPDLLETIATVRRRLVPLFTALR
jgi:Nucleotidyl transferase AbiEii toxin, Type IV TA system